MPVAVANHAAPWTVTPRFPFNELTTEEQRDFYTIVLWSIAELGGDVACGTTTVSAIRDVVERYTDDASAVSRALQVMDRYGWIEREGGGSQGVRITRVRLLRSTLPTWPDGYDKMPSIYPGMNGSPDAPVIPMPLPPKPKPDDDEHDPRPVPGAGAARLNAILNKPEPPDPRRIHPATYAVDRKRYNDGHTVSLAPPEPKPEPEPERVAETEPVDELAKLRTDLRGLAASLVEIIDRVNDMELPVAETEPERVVVDDKLAERLATTLDENERLRAKVRTLESKLTIANDTATAHNNRAAGAERTNRELRAQLDAVTKAAGFDVNAYRQFKDTDRTMRAVPGTTKGGDLAHGH